MIDEALKRDLEMAAALMREAADVLEGLGPEVVEKLPNWRWPLTDELGGAALILLDRARAQVPAQPADQPPATGKEPT